MSWRILHTEWSDGMGGQERRVLQDMQGMRARGHRVWLATRPQARIAEAARALGLAVLTYPFGGKFDFRTILPLACALRRLGIDLVNTHSSIDSWAGGIAARLARARLVRTRHLDLPLKRGGLNWVHALPDAWITCGDRMRTNLVEGCGFPSERVVSIPTGIDFEGLVPQRMPATVRAGLGLGVDDFVVLMVGVIRAVKRHEVALAAFARLVTELPSARLLIAGDGPMRAWIEAHAHELGIAGKTRFLGERNDVGELIGASDVLLLSSRSEGVPQAVTQALGLGRPVVATRVGGVPELVEDGVSGKLVDPEDAVGMAHALATLAADAALRSRMGEAGREHVRTHYSLATMLDRTEALYRRLLGARRTS